jgi:hypothetical protein
VASQAVYLERPGVRLLVFKGAATEAESLARLLVQMLDDPDITLIRDDGQQRLVYTAAADGAVTVQVQGPSTFNSRRERVGDLRHRLVHRARPSSPLLIAEEAPDALATGR